MRENGFLEVEWAEVSLTDVLATKASQELIYAGVEDRINEVIALMKHHDISQVPALNPDGSLAGFVTEVDLLMHMLNGHQHSPDETIASIVQPAEAVFPIQASLEEVLPSIVDGYVILVTEADRPVGILTKIDVLDFIAQNS
jgi:cystathionine beta-synthase